MGYCWDIVSCISHTAGDTVAVTNKLKKVVKEDGAITVTNKLKKVVKEDGAIAAATTS